MKRLLTGLLVAVLVLVCTTALGLGLIHLTDWPYTADLDALDIPASSGVPRDVALDNYRAVIAFLSPFSNTAFSLPTLDWSADGAAHFADCKPIFNGIYGAGAVSLLLFVILARRGALRDRRMLLVSGCATLAIPAALLLAVAVDFDRAFVLFHTVFFPGATNWIFDPAVDPVIEILPETFFLHCALVIAGGWVLASVIQLLCARRAKHREA